jgi:hypothetical protein
MTNGQHHLMKQIGYLYHGTESTALEAIVRDGLVPQIGAKEPNNPILGPIHALRPDRLTWFTNSLTMAIGVAEGRAAQRQSDPVVLAVRGQIGAVDAYDEGIGNDWGDRLWVPEIVSPDRLDRLIEGRWVPIV